MTKDEVCQLIKDVGIVPAVKVSSAEDAHFAADCVNKGGIPIVEITLTVPEAVALISHLVHHHKKIVVGAGTVLNTEMAQQSIDAGANFLTSPSLDTRIVEFAARAEIAVLPGALTPTEVVTAWNAGADFIKVFPCAEIGGERYIRALKASLPQIPLIAAGGITQQTATSFILAGADAIGIGNEIIPPDAIEHRESDRIRELAQRFAGFVKEARSRMPAQKKPEAANTTDFMKLDKRAPRK